MNRATDIADLEKMLNDGEGDGDLCNRAIEIFERLRGEAHRLKQPVHAKERARIEAEAQDFVNVVGQIKQRRHEHALDQFEDYLDKQPG